MGMAQNRRQEFKERKQAYVQEEILLSAVTLFAHRGFRAVTIDEIASSLGYTKSVIYYYFRSKGDILRQIFSRNYDEYFCTFKSVSELGLGPKDMLKHLLREHALNVMERPEWNAIYWREESELEDQQRQEMVSRKRDYASKLESIYALGIEAGEVRPIPPGVAVRAMLGMINSSYTWFKPNGLLPSSGVAEHFVDMLMGGFASEEATAAAGLSRRSNPAGDRQPTDGPPGS